MMIVIRSKKEDERMQSGVVDSELVKAKIDEHKEVIEADMC